MIFLTETKFKIRFIYVGVKAILNFHFDYLITSLSAMTFLPTSQSQHQAQQQGLPERHDPRHLLLGNLDLSPSVHMCGDLAHTEVRTALAVCLRRVLPWRRLLTDFVKTYKLGPIETM